MPRRKIEKLSPNEDLQKVYNKIWEVPIVPDDGKIVIYEFKNEDGKKQYKLITFEEMLALGRKG